MYSTLELLSLLSLIFSHILICESSVPPTSSAQSNPFDLSTLGGDLPPLTTNNTEPKVYAHICTHTKIIYSGIKACPDSVK